jgi:redox-sensitive bicupin YhaK (pirin superfamily)
VGGLTLGSVSNLERDPGEEVGGGAAVAVEPVRELLIGREVTLGPRGNMVTRTLPHRDRRMVGAWCFADHYGPEDVAGTAGMQVPPHPHTGLQTVSWLVTGRILHRDSLGNRQLIESGQLNVMTAGRGIAHSEESPAGHPPVLHGVQLWVALPDERRNVEPAFEHHAVLPVLADGGLSLSVLVGEVGGLTGPGRAYSPLVGAEATLTGPVDARLPVRPDFEYAALVLAGEVEVDGVPLVPGPLLYLGCGRSDLALRADPTGPAARPARLLLLGGEPFEERIVMWWNFVGRSHEEIVAFRSDWEAGRGFGRVHGYPGGALPAPPMPTTMLKPRGRIR